MSLHLFEQKGRNSLLNSRRLLIPGVMTNTRGAPAVEGVQDSPGKTHVGVVPVKGAFHATIISGLIGPGTFELRDGPDVVNAERTPGDVARAGRHLCPVLVVRAQCLKTEVTDGITGEIDVAASGSGDIHAP